MAIKIVPAESNVGGDIPQKRNRVLPKQSDKNVTRRAKTKIAVPPRLSTKEALEIAAQRAFYGPIEVNLGPAPTTPFYDILIHSENRTINVRVDAVSGKCRIAGKMSNPTASCR
ncbi:MAG: PepSY domain-containing protein [Burkholderiales bacterium]